MDMVNSKELNKCHLSFCWHRFWCEHLGHMNLQDVQFLFLKRPVGGIHGFSRETVVEVQTTNIESLELRRLANVVIGSEEHPRAAETDEDDLESYVCVCHCDLGSILTLKQFQAILA